MFHRPAFKLLSSELPEKSGGVPTPALIRGPILEDHDAGSSRTDAFNFLKVELQKQNPEFGHRALIMISSDPCCRCRRVSSERPTAAACSRATKVKCEYRRGKVSGISSANLSDFYYTVVATGTVPRTRHLAVR
jgi:hypothetical protein